MDHTLMVRFLGHSPLFRGLDQVALGAVAGCAEWRHVESGEFFFEQGESAAFVHLLHDGRVKISQRTGQGQKGLLRFLGPGETFGQVALLVGRMYPVSAQAVTWSHALCWTGDAIATLMAEHPRIACNAIGELIVRLEELQGRFRELATEPVEQRVAHALMTLAGQVGWRIPDGLLLDLPLSRRDLAEIAGTTLYTVSRILRTWERCGLVKVGRLRVLIVTSDGLLTVAQGGSARVLHRKRDLFTIRQAGSEPSASVASHVPATRRGPIVRASRG